MPDEAVLRMDRATTEDLWTSMYVLGEHFAAGMSAEENQAVVLGDVREVFGAQRCKWQALGQAAGCRPAVTASATSTGSPISTG